jgi:hypothetical protein
LLKSEKLYAWIWKQDAVCMANARLEVSTSHAYSATGSKQPQMVTDEMEQG